MNDASERSTAGRDARPNRLRLVLGAIALLCVPAGLVLLAVALLHENPPPDRPPPAFVSGTTTTTAPHGTWALDPDGATVRLGVSGGQASSATVSDGGVAVDGDLVLGGVISFVVPGEAVDDLGAGGSSSAQFVIDGVYDIGTSQAMRGSLIVGDQSWSVVGTGTFDRTDTSGQGRLTWSFEGQEEAGTGAPDLELVIGVAFVPSA